MIKTPIATYAAPGSYIGVKGNGVLQHGTARAEGNNKLLMPLLPLQLRSKEFK